MLSWGKSVRTDCTETKSSLVRVWCLSQRSKEGRLPSDHWPLEYRVRIEGLSTFPTCNQVAPVQSVSSSKYATSLAGRRRSGAARNVSIVRWRMGRRSTISLYVLLSVLVVKCSIHFGLLSLKVFIFQPSWTLKSEKVAA